MAKRYRTYREKVKAEILANGGFRHSVRRDDASGKYGIWDIKGGKWEVEPNWGAYGDADDFLTTGAMLGHFY